MAVSESRDFRRRAQGRVEPWVCWTVLCFSKWKLEAKSDKGLGARLDEPLSPSGASLGSLMLPS